jgi:zinc D-Ala-D-Ala dipeptidase
MKLIPDKKLIEIPVRDNGEKLVSVTDIVPQVQIKLGAYLKKESKTSCAHARYIRENVAHRLNLAQSLLPKGYRLVLRCGYRPLSIQKKRYAWMHTKLKKAHPIWTNHRLMDETSKRVAPPNIIPPHSTGGAVDITIRGKNGKLLDMGTKLGQFNSKTKTDSKEITIKQKKNRKLLITIMTRAEFINYPTEWWHWSYGDRYWAAFLQKKYSIYDGL